MKTLQLLAVWIRIFKKRKDVDAKSTMGKKLSPTALAAAKDQLPADLIELGAETSRMLLEWRFAGTNDWHRLDLRVPAASAWASRPQGWLGSWEERAELEPITNERRAVLSRYPGQRRIDAVIDYDFESEAQDGLRYGTVRDYLAAGARVGFATGWQRGQLEAFPDEVTRKLRGGALASVDREAITRGLVAQGATPDEASALWDWLGAGAALLVPAAAPIAAVGDRPTAFKIKGGAGTTEPVLDGDRAYWAYDGRLTCHALDAKGKRTWTIDVGPVMALVKAGTKLVAATAEAVRWIDPATGATTYKLEQPHVASLFATRDAVIAVLAERVHIDGKWMDRAEAPEVRVLDAETGAAIATYALSGSRTVLQAMSGNDFVALALATPLETLWVVRRNSAQRLDWRLIAAHGAQLIGARMAQWEGASQLAPERLATLDARGEVHAVVDSHTLGHVALGDDVMVALTRQGGLSATETSTLADRWRTELPTSKPADSAPILVGDVGYVWLDGHVRAFALADGSLRWRSADAIADAALTASDRWIVARSRGRTPTLYVFAVA